MCGLEETQHSAEVTQQLTLSRLLHVIMKSALWERFQDGRHFITQTLLSQDTRGEYAAVTQRGGRA